MSDKKSLRVLGSNVLLIPYTQEETKNGIYIPTTSQKQQVKIVCYVSTVGPEIKNKDLLTEGTFVVIPRHTGKYVEFDDFKYYLVNEDDILAIIDGMRMEEQENG